MNSKPWCTVMYGIVTYKEYDNSNVFFRNSEDEEIFDQNLICQGISFFSQFIDFELQDDFFTLPDRKIEISLYLLYWF